jgi:hypothetical protein
MQATMTTKMMATLRIGTDMKLFEATVRRPDGTEFKDRVGANDAQEARMLLQQRHGPRAIPYVPRMIPS